MYLPETDSQMFDILSALRVYAGMNALHGLAEELDDALVLLAVGPEGASGERLRGQRRSPLGRDAP